MCFWCFDIWSLVDSGKTAPLRVSQILEIVNNLPVSVPFICKPINLEPIHQPSFLSELSQWSHTLGLYSLVLITSRPDTRQTAPMPQSLLKLFKLANPNLLTLPCLVLHIGITRRTLGHIYLLLPLPLDYTDAFPQCGLVCLLFWEICQYKNFFLHDSHFCVRTFYHNNFI